MIAQITQLKSELDSRVQTNTNMEAMYSAKIASLQKQLDSSTQKLRESDKFVKHLRRRDASSKEDLVKAKGQLAQQKCLYDETIGNLQRAKSETEEKLRRVEYDLNDQIENWSHQYQNVEEEYNRTREELQSLHENTSQLLEKSRKFNELDAQLEVQRNDLQRANRRVAELENEIAAFGDWKDMSKTFQQRIAKVPDLEKEVERLRRENKNIHDTIGNKLLLEEEVFDLKTRLAQHETVHDQLVAMQTSVRSMEAELVEYKAVARDHCGSHSIVSPIHLRSRIEDILRNDLVMQNDKCSANSEKDSASAEVQTLRKELEILTKSNDNLQTSLKYHKTSMHRVQKKLSLVAKERDCYKQLIDNYEKDLTSKYLVYLIIYLLTSIELNLKKALRI